MLKILSFLSIFILCLSIPAAAQKNIYELVKVSFEGNHNISDSDLSLVIVSQQTPVWYLKLLNKISSSIGKEPTYFDSTKIKNDLKSLETYYKDNGFFKAKFKAEYKLDQDAKEARLTFHINEGPEFRISSFKVTGLEALSQRVGKEAAAFINKIDSNDVYKKTNIEIVRQSLVSLFIDRGFYFANTSRRDVFVDTSKNVVGVILGFDTGKRYRISEIRVKKDGPGKDFIQDTLIKRLAGLQVGAYYGREETRTAQIRLVRTNLFSSALVAPVIKDTVSNRFPIEITTEIGKLHELSPEIILDEQNQALSFGVGANYQKKNFLGDARNLTLRGATAIQDIFNVDYRHINRFLAPEDTSIMGYLDTRLTVTQPFLFNKRIASTFETYFTINKQKGFRSYIYGGKVSLDFELPKIVYLNSLQTYYYLEKSEYNFSIDYLKSFLKNQGYSTQSIDSLLKEINSNQVNSISSVIGINLGTDKTNSIIFPTNGYKTTITFEEGNTLPYLLSKIGIKKFSPETQFYKVIGNIVVFPNVYNSDVNAFGIKLRVGHLQAYEGSNSNLPLNQRFVIGGSNSVRGWHARDKDLLPPPNVNAAHLGYEIIKSNEQLVAGGTFFIEGSFETRNRLIGKFGTALFLDYGNTSNYDNIDLKKMAVAAGFGLRYYSDFAPIRVDFGFKVYNPHSQTGFFYIMKHSSFWNTFSLQFGLGEAF
jgi:outer membrane protein assembly factor BamA